MLMDVHAHLIGAEPMGSEWRKLIAHMPLALVTGVGEKMAQEAICFYNAGETPVPKVIG